MHVHARNIRTFILAVYIHVHVRTISLVSIVYVCLILFCALSANRCAYAVLNAFVLRVQTYVMLRPFAAHAQLFYLDRPRKTHTVSTKPFEAATCSDGLCVQLYNSITYSKKEKNTKNSVIFTPTFLFSSKKKVLLGNRSTFTSGIKL